MTQCYFEDRYLDTSVYLWEDLSSDHSIQGPAIIIDKNRLVISWKYINTTLYIVISGASWKCCHSSHGFSQLNTRKKTI